MKACDPVAAVLHELHRRWIRDLLDRGSLVPGSESENLTIFEVETARLRELASTPFRDLPEQDKQAARRWALEVQKVYIGEGDDDEAPSQQKGNHGNEA